MHSKQIVTGGLPLLQASRALILLHGRGADAHDILSVAAYLDTKGFALLAPQAANNKWYPYSFLAPPAQNEPWLGSALGILQEIVSDTEAGGIAATNIYLCGFSQGACLALEFAARNARRYGGVIAFTGGLIGDHIYPERYHGRFEDTPVFIGSSNPDPHVPVERVLASVAVLNSMGARVTEKLYPGMGHSINEDELGHATSILQAGNVSGSGNKV